MAIVLFDFTFRMQAILKTVFMNYTLSPKKLTVATQKVYSWVTLYACIHVNYRLINIGKLNLTKSSQVLIYYAMTGIATALSGIGKINGVPLVSIAAVCSFSSASLTVYSKYPETKTLLVVAQQNSIGKLVSKSGDVILCWLQYGLTTVYIACLCSVSVSEGKRASGLTAVWVARNRFAVLDRTHNVRFIY